MNKTQELATKLQSAMESNERIHTAKREIVYQEAEIKTIDEHTRILMMQSTLKQMRIDALNKELENAVEIDIKVIQKEIEELG